MSDVGVDIMDELFIKFEIIEELTLKKRLVREISSMIDQKFCTLNDVDIEMTNNTNLTGEKYRIKMYDTSRKNYYEFCVPSSYPFHPPKLILNHKSYFHYLKIVNPYFQKELHAYKSKNCLCCSSILCNDNWSAFMSLKTIVEEVNEFTDICRQITHVAIVNAIKRKYLLTDINILEWLY